METIIAALYALIGTGILGLVLWAAHAFYRLTKKAARAEMAEETARRQDKILSEVRDAKKIRERIVSDPDFAKRVRDKSKRPK